MNAVWPITATESPASDIATMATAAAPSMRPNEIARASGVASARRPTAAGTVMKNPSDRPRTRVARNAATSPSRCIRASRGSRESATGVAPSAMAR